MSRFLDAESIAYEQNVLLGLVSVSFLHNTFEVPQPASK